MFLRRHEGGKTRAGRLVRIAMVLWEETPTGGVRVNNARPCGTENRKIRNCPFNRRQLRTPSNRFNRSMRTLLKRNLPS